MRQFLDLDCYTNALSVYYIYIHLIYEFMFDFYFDYYLY